MRPPNLNADDAVDAGTFSNFYLLGYIGRPMRRRAVHAFPADDFTNAAVYRRFLGDHYRVLRTVEAAYGLPGLGVAAGRTPIDGVWR